MFPLDNSLAERHSDAGMHDPSLVGEQHRLHAIAKPELHQNAGDVSLGRVLADHEFLGDLGV